MPMAVLQLSSSRIRRMSSSNCEHAWILVGRRKGRVWYARRIGRYAGEPASVEFDGAAVLVREERKRDVVGFLHTHPVSEATPSRRDLDTMRAWVSAFGKPLLCVIEGTDGLAGYRFDDDESRGERLVSVELFPRGVVIGVDAEQVPPAGRAGQMGRDAVQEPSRPAGGTC